MSIPIRSASVACGAVALGLSLAGAAQAGTLNVTSAVNGNVLTATSTAADAIAITCDGQGQVKVNGSNPDTGAFNCAALTGIVVEGGPGDNAIDLGGIAAPAVSATLPVTVRGGAGDDTITGTALADKLFGEDGNDRITGFRGDDAVDGGADGDTMIWNNGDNTDTNDGQDGTDTTQVNGAGAAGDAFTVKPGNGGRVRFDRTNLVPFAIDIGTTERLQLNGGGGDDTMDGSTPGLAGLIRTEMNGGDGNDALTGTDGADLIAGAAGNDRLTGFRGDDVVDGGDGDDTTVWNNGDNTDVNDGQGGSDTTEVNGAGAAGDAFTVNPNGARVRFDRTNLVPFAIDIGSTEQLRLNGGGGDDTMNGSANAGLAALIRTEMNGGDGNDALTGTDGADRLTGGAGNDRLTGFRGGDDVDGGDGDDTMVWNNGDGSDTNDGDAGTDTTEVNGATPQGDTFTVKPGNGGRVDFDRVNLVAFQIDIGSTERLDVNGGGGDDSISGARGLARLIALDLDGQDGNDALRGGDGRDVLAGGNGNDAIRAFDRQVDQVDCGAGRDRAQVDRIDRVRGCEAVNRQPDRVKPDIRILRPVFDRRVIRVVVVCPRSEWRCTGQLGFRRAGKRLGSSRIAVDGGSRKTFRLRLTASGKRQLRGVRRLSATARYTVRDTSGNARSKRVPKTLRRA